jgi:hypothetical protein
MILSMTHMHINNINEDNNISSKPNHIKIALLGSSKNISIIVIPTNPITRTNLTKNNENTNYNNKSKNDIPTSLYENPS